MRENKDGLNRRELMQGSLSAAAMMGLKSLRAEALIPGQQTRAGGNSDRRFQFDGSRVPLSRFGSYLAVSRHFWDFGVTEETPKGNYYIRCLQDDPVPAEIFRIEMLRQGVPIDPQVEATSGCLILKDGEARVEFCIADMDVIRMRGRGCTVKLHGIMGSYGNAFQDSADSWQMMPDAARSPVQVKRLAGSMQVDAPWINRLHNVEVDKAVFTFDQTGALPFECAMQFFEGVPRDHVSAISFDRAVAAVEAEFETWAARLPELAPAYEPSRKLAAYVLWSNTARARGLYKWPVVWGSKNWMARIWSWDQCFHAMGLAQSHPELAWQQFMVFHEMQDPVSGMLADSMSTIKRSWVCTKDPVHGWTLGHLMRLMPQAVTQERLREAYGPLTQWTEFWMKYRNYDGDGLPCIIHPDESFDNTTNNTLGGAVKAPEIATYLTLQMDTLAVVADKLGYPADAQRWRQASNRLVQAMLRVLWEPKRQRFVSRRVGDGYVGPGDCVLTFMPLMLGQRLPAPVRQALVAGLKQQGRFATPYGFSTEALDSPLYNSASYVRGPTWAPLNMMLCEALNNVGETALARTIESGFCDAIVRGGMSEHFDARTGAPEGDPSYSWTPAIFLLMSRKKNQ